MVPICANYCDEWFDACKSDFTCVQDWFGGFNITNSIYSCPTNSSCRTFQEVRNDFLFVRGLVSAKAVQAQCVTLDFSWNLSKLSLKKHPTFRDATTGFENLWWRWPSLANATPFKVMIEKITCELILMLNRVSYSQVILSKRAVFSLISQPKSRGDKS